MASKAQSFMLAEEQATAVEEMMNQTGMKKSDLMRYALSLAAIELGVNWPDDPKAGRPWHKERESDESNDEA